MGCHTLFSRPITDKEFELMKEYAPIEIFNLTGSSEENMELGLNNEFLYKQLMKSFVKNIPCVYGKYWWQLGYGAGNPQLLNGSAYIYEIRGRSGLFVDIPEYEDIFRVKHYPRKVITNRRNLKRWMRKDYFKLSKEQLDKVSEFFEQYPDGVITFG